MYNSSMSAFLCICTLSRATALRCQERHTKSEYILLQNALKLELKLIIFRVIVIRRMLSTENEPYFELYLFLVSTPHNSSLVSHPSSPCPHPSFLISHPFYMILIHDLTSLITYLSPSMVPHPSFVIHHSSFLNHHPSQSPFRPSALTPRNHPFDSRLSPEVLQW